MRTHDLANPTLTFLAALVIAPTLVYGAGNPLKPRMAPSTSIPSLSSSPEEFICGTYRGNENQSKQLHHWYQTRLQSVAPLATTPPTIFDDVWILEDDGTLLFSGTNLFDTDFQTFRFTPNGNGSYDITSVTFNFDGVLGTNLFLGDDSNAIVSPAFTFNYFGVGWSNINVNANGIIAFGGNINPTGFYDNDDFYSTLPKLAAYFIDLNPFASGGVYFKSEPTKATITWNQLPEYGTANFNTIQLVLYDNHSFDLTFNGIASTLAVNGTPITIGTHPGGNPPLENVSFSSDIPFTGAANAGALEQYFNLPQPRVNEVALLQRFYQNFSDDYFQVVFFTTFVQTMSGFANEFNIKNQVSGIGLGIFDNSALYGSAGTLESRCNMNRLAAWPTDPTSRIFGGENNFLTIMGQEAGHRWGAFVNFLDSTGTASNMILGRADAHWSYYVDVDHSSLEGGNWQHVSGNLYTTPTKIDYFGDIDEYTMGLRTPQEVTSAFYVSSPTNDLPQNRDKGTPPQGTLATGTPITVTIDDIIAAEGPRVPTEPNENKDLRQAFILIHLNGEVVTSFQKSKVAGFRRAWEDYFEVAVDGRITVNTSLTQNLPVAVVEGLVLGGGVRTPLDSVTVQALERGFDQFVVSGGRYTFRFMPESLPAPDSVCTTIAFSRPGFRPDTLALCIDYGTTATEDIELWPVATGIPGGDTPPVVRVLSLEGYPNPFNPLTTLRYDIPEAGSVRLNVYDVRGRKVRTLVNKHQRAGEHAIIWNGRNDYGGEVSSGIYMVRLEAGGDVRTRKMVFLK